MGSKNLLVGFKVKEDVIDPKTDDVVLKAGKKVTLGAAKKLSRFSRSAKVEVDPESLIQKYGADTARLFVLFKAPPEKDLEWNDSDVEGQYRFIQRIRKSFLFGKFRV